MGFLLGLWLGTCVGWFACALLTHHKQSEMRLARAQAAQSPWGEPDVGPDLRGLPGLDPSEARPVGRRRAAAGR